MGTEPGRYRAILIDPSVTLLDDLLTTRPRDTPIDAFIEGLGGLLRRIAPRYADRDGVLLLSERSCVALGLPTGPIPKEGFPDHPALAQAAGYGWDGGTRLGDWTTFRAEGQPAIHVGLITHMSGRKVPLVALSVADTVGSFALWHQLTGRAFHRTPGVAGMSILADSAPTFTTKDGKRVEPTWKPKVFGPDRKAAYERDYGALQWRNDDQPGAWEHAYDLTRMYVSAATVVKLSPWKLANTRVIEFDPTRAGWWLVELSPWQLDHMPDPAGYGRDRDNPVRWITTPTAALLDELAGQGIYGGFKVLDSWTGPSELVLAKWAKRMREAYDACAKHYDENDAERVRKTIKWAGRQTLGLLNSQTNFAIRPDWWFSTLAMARCNLWRKMWEIGNTVDRWPLRIETDNVFYASDNPDPVAARPFWVANSATGPQERGIRLADKLGFFKVKPERSGERKAA